MGVILDTVMKAAEEKYKIMITFGKEDSIDVDAEIDKLDALAKKMEKAEMTAIELLYDTKTQALPLSVPARILKYRTERFMSDDTEQFGETGVRLSFNNILAQSQKDMNKYIEEELEKHEKKLQEKAEKNSKSRIQKEKSEEEVRKNEVEKRDEEAKAKLAKEHKDDLLLRAHSIAKMAEHNVENFTNSKKAAYEEEEAKVDADAKLSGYTLGAQDVKKYNDGLMKNAKKYIDKIRKAEAKVMIIKGKAIQTAKLKIAALVGL